MYFKSPCMMDIALRGASATSVTYLCRWYLRAKQFMIANDYKRRVKAEVKNMDETPKGHNKLTQGGKDLQVSTNL
jgi:hypothetical protein